MSKKKHVHFGLEWVKEMKKFRKDALIAMLAKSFITIKKLSNVKKK
jgi:hypothetical protein